MLLTKNGLKWFLWRRKKMKNTITGFHAHWNTSVSPNSTFEEYTHLFDGASVNDTHIGRFSKVIGSKVSFSEIGSFVSLAPRCVVGGGGDHPLDQVSHHSLFYSPSDHQHPCLKLTKDDKYINDLRKTFVGNDVWIGSDAIVKHGVRIGDGAVIAAGAVVVSNVPPYAIVGGVPAKIIKYRHTPELRQALIESKWWDWPVESLKVISMCFNGDEPLTIDGFNKIKEKARTFLL